MSERREDKPGRHPYTKEEARAMLPEVGDRLMMSPVHEKEIFGRAAPRRSCTVVHVNRPHCWFSVVFDHNGVRESYKVPADAVIDEGGALWRQK